MRACLTLPTLSYLTLPWQYHESLPFRFREGYSHRRVNLTLLFGDRWRPISHQVSAQEATDDGWDVFD